MLVNKDGPGVSKPRPAMISIGGAGSSPRGALVARRGAGVPRSCVRLLAIIHGYPVMASDGVRSDPPRTDAGHSVGVPGDAHDP